MPYVIRSMSTTDAGFAPLRKPEPYHIYLMRPECRAGARWSNGRDVMVFATPQEAEAEAVRINLKGGQIALWVKDAGMPTYWELDAMNREAGIGYPVWEG